MRTYTLHDLVDTNLQYAAFSEYFVEFKDGSTLSASARSVEWEAGDEPEWRFHDADGDEFYAYISAELGALLDAAARETLGATVDADSCAQLARNADFCVPA